MPAINVPFPQRQAQVGEEALCFFLFRCHHLHCELLEWTEAADTMHEDRQTLVVLLGNKKTALHTRQNMVGIEGNVDIFNGAFRCSRPTHERRAAGCDQIGEAYAHVFLMPSDAHNLDRPSRLGQMAFDGSMHVGMVIGFEPLGDHGQCGRLALKMVSQPTHEDRVFHRSLQGHLLQKSFERGAKLFRCKLHDSPRYADCCGHMLNASRGLNCTAATTVQTRIFHPNSGRMRDHATSCPPTTGRLYLPRAQPYDGPARAVSPSRRLRRLPVGVRRALGTPRPPDLGPPHPAHALAGPAPARRRWETEESGRVRECQRRFLRSDHRCAPPRPHATCSTSSPLRKRWFLMVVSERTTTIKADHPPRRANRRVRH